MTLHRFFLPPECFEPRHVTFPDHTAHQMRRVLRLRSGDQAIVLDGSGKEYVVRLTISAEAVEGTIEHEQENTTEPPIQLTLYQGLLKGAKFELVLQKCTELGVARFVPVNTARSVAAEPGEARLHRFEAIVREAAEQSGRGRIPQVGAPETFGSALRMAMANGPSIMLYEEEEDRRLTDVPILAATPREISVFVGPEGGFAPEEADAAVGAGAELVTLGPRILRAETAAIAGTALLLDYLR